MVTPSLVSFFEREKDAGAQTMAAGGYPSIPQGVIAGGSGIPASGVYCYAPMGNVYNGAAIAGSSRGGRQGLQPPQPRVTVWTPGEHEILMEGLQRYSMDSIFDIYAKIAVVLPEKTIRDVALRHKWWMTRTERRRRIRDGLCDSVINSDKKERIIYPSNSHAVPMPHMSSNDNGDARRTLFGLNKEIFKKVSENPQANENMELLYNALNNFTNIVRICNAKEKEIPNKMPPFPMNLNAQLARFIAESSVHNYTRD